MPEQPAAVPAVVVDGVCKRFRIPQERVHTLKERALHPFRRTRHEDLITLEDVSFSVRPGEFFGIVGRNGSGKSTLLKCLAGIYSVDRGRIYVNGRVATFIELGVGFNPDLPARDNIILNGVMLGLSPAEARARVDDVIRFAELQQFTDLKLKNYSSGMQVRLAFSVMIQVDADILLIDEVLAVGDAAFQQKCYDEFNRMRAEGRTILFVTHDMQAVSHFCHRAMLLEGGEIAALGDPDEVADEYIRVNFAHGTPGTAADEGEAAVAKVVTIADAWFETEGGQRVEYLPEGAPCAFRALLLFKRDLDDPVFDLTLENDDGHKVFHTSTALQQQDTGRWTRGDHAVFGVIFQNILTPGRYYATVAVTQRGHGRLTLDKRERVVSMVTTGPRQSGGVVDLPHDVDVRRPVAPAPWPMPRGEAEETRA